MEDLDPHSQLYEMMAFSGHFLPVYEGVNITYYKRYRQADIMPCGVCEYPYVDGNGEPELLRGTAAKIMLMRDIINKIGVGGQVDSGVDKNTPAEIKSMYKPKEIPKVIKISNYIEEKFTVQKFALC